MKRRDFLKGSALAGAASFLRPSVARSQIVRPKVSVRARNVIFFAYDGFSWQDFARAKQYAARHEHRTLAIERLFSLGASGNQMTESLASIVTDSAAASSAWATGRKTVNGHLSTYPDGRKLTTILELARGVGKATGLITSARVTHATPAGFAAHVEERGAEDAIALSYLDSRPDVIMGGGFRHFDPQTRKDGQDLLPRFQEHGYQVLRTSGDLASATSSRLLGVFSKSHVPYEIDRRFQGVETPTLADMVVKGLAVLSGQSNGFVVQVEAGRIDHANHSNDAGAALWETLAADEALEAILSFVDHNPDTLLILVSDHATGGGGTYGVGETYQLSSTLFDRIADRKASFEFTLGELGKTPEPSLVREVIRKHAGVELSSQEALMVVDAIAGDLWLPIRTAYWQQPDNTIAYILASGGDPHSPDRLNVNYATGEHTSEPVPIALYGAGTGGTQIGLVDNTAPYGWMTEAICVSHENPLMSEEEALRVVAEKGEGS